MSLGWKVIKTFTKRSVVATAYIGYVGCVLHCTQEYLTDVVICQGPSMEPTLFSHDVILTEHLSITRKKIKRGDIIIAKSPSNPREYICKRIKGIPGDKIKKNLTTHVVPLGHVWLEGDNHSNSTDSRTYGPVPIGLLRSRALCRIFPFERAQMFSKT
ncbi:mitochondrial inner membrane protease subunit 1 [Parasteatoda tepidariorum]|uniref:mitochondrial inner membrane protease subunit 1 n=1 Tax=Parasteatoda tepidariorum TaxID=114398 RepID=UPI0039BCB577